MWLLRDIDQDGDRELSWNEFADALEKQEVIEILQSLDVDVSDARSLFHCLDKDGNGNVSLDEFVFGMQEQAKLSERRLLIQLNHRVMAIFKKQDISPPLSPPSWEAS